jgi:hypothetical protein
MLSSSLCGATFLASGIVEAERNYSPLAGSRQAKNAESVPKTEQGVKSGEIG